MQHVIESMGYLAALFTTAAFIPQVLMVWRQRSARGVSLGMYLAFCLGVCLWLCYGLIIGAWPVAISNACTLVLAASVLVMKWRFDYAPARAAARASLRPSGQAT